VRLDHQPQFSRTTGTWRAHPFDVAGYGRGGGCGNTGGRAAAVRPMGGEPIFPVLLRGSGVPARGPFDRSSLKRWRQRLGEEQIVALLQESLSVAHPTGAIATKDLERVLPVQTRAAGTEISAHAAGPHHP